MSPSEQAYIDYVNMLAGELTNADMKGICDMADAMSGQTYSYCHDGAMALGMFDPVLNSDPINNILDEVEAEEVILPLSRCKHGHLVHHPVGCPKCKQRDDYDRAMGGIGR